MQTVRVEDVRHLVRLASAGIGVHIFIQLAGGVRSSKFISLQNGRFHIHHEIDGSEQWLRPESLPEAGLLLEAINTGNCFAELS